MALLWIRTTPRAVARPLGIVITTTACLLGSLPSVPGAEAPKKAPAKGDVSQFQVRRFSLPPDFLSLGGADQASSPADPFAAPTDPFAAQPAPSGTASSETPFPRAKSAREILTEQGISFPEGTDAVFDPKTGTLIVRNSSENLQLIESFVDSIRSQAPKRLSLTLHLIEAPGPLLRLLTSLHSPNGDLTTGLQRLMQTATTQPDSGVRILTTGFLQTKSGQRCTLEADTEYAYATEVALDKKGRSSVVSEMRPLGFRVEIDPVIEADGKIIDLNLAPEYTTAPPESRQETVEEPITGSTMEFPITQFHAGKVQTSLAMASGTTHLVGMWKAPENRPNDDRDLQQAVFLTAHVVQVGAPSRSVVDQPSLSLPSRPGEELTRAFDVPADFLLDGFRPSPRDVKAALITAGIPLSPSSTARWNEKGQLEVRAPIEALEVVAASIDNLWQLTPKNLSFQVEIFRAPAPLVREILAENASRDDHASALTRLQSAVTTGQVQSLSALFFETKSGHRATNESALERHFISELAWDQARHPTVSTEQRPVGTRMELDPVLGADGKTIDLNLSLEYQPAAPTPRRETFTDPASKQRFDFPRDDFHVEKVQTAIALMSGARTILYVCKPPRNTAGDKDVLDIAMLTSHAVPAVPPATALPAAPADKPKANAESGDPNEMVTRMYRVPPDFFSISAPAQTVPANTSQMIRRKTALEILKEQGIPFPEGSSAIYSVPTTQLIVRNTRANHALIEAFIDSIMGSAPKNIVLTIHLFEGDGPLLLPLVAAAGNRADHHAELARLLDLTKTGQIKPLGTLNLNTRSGQRATVEQVKDHTYVTGTEINDKGEPSVVQDMTPVGLRVEVDPVVGADGYTLDLNLALDYHPAPPAMHRESFSHPNGERLADFPLTDFHHAKLLTALTLADGTARILGLWKPTGRPEFDSQDRLQIAFLEAKLVTVMQNADGK